SGAESLSAGGAAESVAASTSQVAPITVSEIAAASPLTSTSAAVIEPKTILPVAASDSSTAADQMDRALLLILNSTPPAIVANLGDATLAPEAEDSASPEDAATSDADVMAVAWQSWTGL
ncbi:MAG TPA: hypothetical protein VGJ26_22540, partial [Pirellulales bacterium]